MSIARGWGENGDKEREEDFLKSSLDKFIKEEVRPKERKDKIKRILDNNETTYGGQKWISTQFSKIFKINERQQIRKEKIKNLFN